MSGSSRVLWPMVILLRISQKGNESSSLCLSLHLCLFPQTKHIGFLVQPHRTTHTCQAMPYFLLHKVLHNLFPLPGIPTLTFLFHLVRLLTIFQTCQSYSHLRAFALAILSAWNVLSPHLHVATPSFHCLHFNPTSWSTLSVPSTQRPPGTYLQWSELGLLLVAMKEREHPPWGNCELLSMRMAERTYSIWARFCLDPSWSQSGFVWCWCSVKLFTFNKRTPQPSCDVSARPRPGCQDCFLFTIIESLLHRRETGGEGGRC